MKNCALFNTYCVFIISITYAHVNTTHDYNVIILVLHNPHNYSCTPKLFLVTFYIDILEYF